MKTCSKCKVEKDLSKFWKNQYSCIACQKEYRKNSPKYKEMMKKSTLKSYYKNREVILENKRKKYSEDISFKERESQRHKVWSSKKREHLRDYMGEWRKKNSELHCMNSQKWREKNPDKSMYSHIASSLRVSFNGNEPPQALVEVMVIKRKLNKTLKELRNEKN